MACPDENISTLLYGYCGLEYSFGSGVDIDSSSADVSDGSSVLSVVFLAIGISVVRLATLLFCRSDSV